MEESSSFKVASFSAHNSPCLNNLNYSNYLIGTIKEMDHYGF